MRRRRIEDMGGTERFVVHLLKERPRTQDEITATVGGTQKHTRFVLNRLYNEGYIVLWPFFEGDAERGGKTGGGKYIGQKYHLLSTDLSVTHDWKFCHRGFEGVGLPEAGLWGTLAGTAFPVEAEKDFVRELQHLRSKTWFTLGDELELIRLWEEWWHGTADESAANAPSDPLD